MTRKKEPFGLFYSSSQSLRFCCFYFYNGSSAINTTGRANFVSQFEFTTVGASYQCGFAQFVMGSSFCFAVFGTSSLLYSHFSTS